MNVKKYTCGNGDGMFESEDGEYIRTEDYAKLKMYLDELFDLAHDNCSGLSNDRLHEIVEKYGDS